MKIGMKAEYFIRVDSSRKDIQINGLFRCEENEEKGGMWSNEVERRQQQQQERQQQPICFYNHIKNEWD